MDKESVFSFLKDNPSFLAENAEELGLQSKSNRKVISFSEVQLATEEEKNKTIKKQLDNFIENAKNNEKIIDHFFDFCIKLIKCHSAAYFSDTLSSVFLGDFGIDGYALKLIPQPNQKDWLNPEFFLPLQSSQTERIEKLTEPVSFHYLPEEMMNWLPKTESPLQSFIQCPLFLKGTKTADSIIILASSDSKHFQPEQDTHYISKMMDAITACLIRLRDY